jgi:hypothetical protein
MDVVATSTLGSPICVPLCRTESLVDGRVLCGLGPNTMCL